VQNIITTLKKLFYLWRRSQVPVKQPIKISRIDNLIIFLVCILISIISSYKLLLFSPLNIADIFSWFLTFTEILISSGVLILVSKKRESHNFFKTALLDNYSSFSSTSYEINLSFNHKSIVFDNSTGINNISRNGKHNSFNLGINSELYLA
jgi:hypothetical protein